MLVSFEQFCGMVCSASLVEQLCRVVCSASLVEQLCRVVCSASLVEQLCRVICSASVVEQLCRVVLVATLSLGPMFLQPHVFSATWHWCLPHHRDMLMTEFDLPEVTVLDRTFRSRYQLIS